MKHTSTFRWELDHFDQAPERVIFRCRCGSTAEYKNFEQAEDCNTAHEHDPGDGWQYDDGDCFENADDHGDFMEYRATCPDCYEPPDPPTYDEALGSACDARERDLDALRLKRS